MAQNTTKKNKKDKSPNSNVAQDPMQPLMQKSTPVQQDNASIQAESTPLWSILGEYVRDLSFEFPSGRDLIQQRIQEQFRFQQQVNLDFKGNNNEPDIVQIALSIAVKGGNETRTIVSCEIVYDAIIQLNTTDDRLRSIILMVDAPRTIFPNARTVITNLMYCSGFSGSILQPVDFAAALMKNSNQE